MEDKIHPAVKLLLSRMESNPDEFCNLGDDDYPSESRWRRIIDLIRSYGSKEEVNLIDEKLGALVLNDVHEEIMRKLLNGEEEPTLKFATSNRYNMQHVSQQAQQQNALADAMAVYNRNFNSPRETSAIRKMLKKVFL